MCGKTSKCHVLTELIIIGRFDKGPDSTRGLIVNGIISSSLPSDVRLGHILNGTFDCHEEEYSNREPILRGHCLENSERVTAKTIEKPAIVLCSA